MEGTMRVSEDDMMQRVLCATTLLWMSGCGVSESRFIERYNERVCAECEDAVVEFCAEEENEAMLICQDAEASGGTGFGCEAELESFFRAGDEFSDCDYDSKAAAECLKGDWVCSNLGVVFFPDYPDICDDVWVCGVAGGTPSE